LPRVCIQYTIYRTGVNELDTIFRIFFGGADMAEKPKDWCTQTEAARLCGLTEGAIRAGIRREELAPETTAGGTRLLRVVDVLRWAQGRIRRSATADL
jgi:hypothetical protein